MKALYESYKSWCENSSLEPMLNTFFGKELTSLRSKSTDPIKGMAGLELASSQATLQGLAEVFLMLNTN